MDNVSKYAVKGYMEEVRRTSDAYHIPAQILDAIEKYANVRLCIEQGITPQMLANSLRNHKGYPLLTASVSIETWNAMSQDNLAWKTEYEPKPENVNNVQDFLRREGVPFVAVFIIKSDDNTPTWGVLKDFSGILPYGQDLTVQTKVDVPFFEINVQDVNHEGTSALFHYDIARLQQEGKLKDITDQVHHTRLYLGEDCILHVYGGYRNNKASLTLTLNAEKELGVLHADRTWEPFIPVADRLNDGKK